MKKDKKVQIVSHQKVMVHPGADCWNQGPRRTAFGYKLLLYFSINMK